MILQSCSHDTLELFLLFISLLHFFLDLFHWNTNNRRFRQRFGLRLKFKVISRKLWLLTHFACLVIGVVLFILFCFCRMTLLLLLYLFVLALLFFVTYCLKFASTFSERIRLLFTQTLNLLWLWSTLGFLFVFLLSFLYLFWSYFLVCA